MAEDFVKFGELFNFESKSRLKAGSGIQKGDFPFFTSSPIQNKFTNNSPQYNGEAIIIGAGGSRPSVHFEAKNFSTSADCIVAKLKKDSKFETKFIYYYLFGNIHILARGFKGIGIKHISKPYIENIEIPIFSLTRQKRLVYYFDSIQQLFDTRKRTLDFLDEYLLSSFMKISGDPLENLYNFPRIKIDDLKSSKPNAIKAGPFGSALTKSAYVKSGYKVYGQEQVINGLDYGDYFINKKKFDELKSCKVKSKDVLITTMGVVGKTAVIPDEYEEGIINPRLIKISFDQTKILPSYFQYLFESPPINNKVLYLSRGIAMKGLNLRIIKNIEIPVPEITTQENFVGLKSIIDKQKDRLQQSLRLIEELFTSLIYLTFNPVEAVDEIKALMNDDIQIELLLNTINTSDFENEEQYSAEIKKLFQILDRTLLEEKGFISSEDEPVYKKGIIQRIKNNKIFLESNKDYKNKIIDETTAA